MNTNKDLNKFESETNFVVNFGSVFKNGVVLKNGNVSFYYPYEIPYFSKIIVRNSLNCIGDEYGFVGEERCEGGLIYHTNLPVEQLYHKDLDTEFRIKVNSDDLKYIGTWEMKNGFDDTLLILCSHKFFKIQKTLLNHILYCINPEYKITKTKWYSDYVGVWTNLPYDENEEDLDNNKEEIL